ncbi:granulocyte colony-stimulating factor receptor [Genypterus blacodes]|uniref:granulocyte colony-stimulating factor receptor n=1 Tax=Genypterus blacodes TaxID=154954 RepID=UPI003F77824B
MTSKWLSATLMLVVFVIGARNEDGMLPCAEVQTAKSVVVLGSPVVATCTIRDDCPLVRGEAIHIEWHLGHRLLPSSPAANDSSRISVLVIPTFNETRAFLTCCVQTDPCQIVGGVEIRAGYLPPVPQSLNCQTNLTSPSTLSCSWDPGQEDTHLLTKYTLHTKIWDSGENYTYRLPTGVHRYAIPRPDFVLFSYMEIYVKAANELGEATSVPIILEPLRSAKFDPPLILRVEAGPKRYGCLRLLWGLSQHQAWVPVNRMNLEVRRKSFERDQWSEQPILVTRISQKRPVEVCRLLHGTQYRTQIRVRYLESPWSEWSGSKSGVTLESAPSGRLDFWMKVSGDHMQKQLNILLFWKPSKQFRANSQNVSYIVSLYKLPGEKGQLCSTTGHHCAFQLPRRARKVFLSAVNGAGKSSPTDVPVFKHRALTAISDLTVRPRDHRSMLVQWRSLLSSGLTGYVVEWKSLMETDLSLMQFDIADRNQTSLAITGSFEPYKPYAVSVYPRFRDVIGHPQTVNAYSREKAPSMVPKIRIKNTWRSYIELTWDEVPLNQRNGIILNYKVFYWDEQRHIKVSVVNADLDERRIILKDLDTLTVYKAFMVVSTVGGNLNGSTIHFKIESVDTVAVVMIVTASGVGLSIMIIFTVMACFSSHKRLRVCFWPAVPDPANSTLKRWTSDSIKDFHPIQDLPEPNPAYLSHLSFLDLSTKLSEDDEVTSDLGESICGSPLTPDYSGTNSDSVPYATVIFSGPYTSQPANQAHVYLRSESTQPLLETEEALTPKCYHNMATDGRQREQCFFGPCHDVDPAENEDSVIIWDDFPFLRALAMNDTQND